MVFKYCPAPLDTLKVVILTGAGISAESGLKTFRDQDGLWENHAIEDVATPEGFNRDPSLVYRFYNERRRQLLSAAVQVNTAHLALARLEARLGKNLTIVTQNVDDLHQRAGNNNVLAMHGQLLSARCMASAKNWYTDKDMDQHSACGCCLPSCGVRPDIVWFGEIPKYNELIEQRLFDADLFVSIGTSGTVYPAAGFVALANSTGAYSIELNLEPSMGNSEFSERHYGLASDIVVAFVQHLLQGPSNV
jgi:NAD-dependent deacetylase